MFLPEENRRGIIASFSSGFPIVRGILSRTRVSLFGWPFVPVPGLQLDRFFLVVVVIVSEAFRWSNGRVFLFWFLLLFWGLLRIECVFASALCPCLSSGKGSHFGRLLSLRDIRWFCFVFGVLCRRASCDVMRSPGKTDGEPC